jgi:hypothetical protein
MPYLANKFRLAVGIDALLFAALLLSGALAALSVASAEGSSASDSEGGYVPHFVAIAPVFIWQPMVSFSRHRFHDARTDSPNADI